MFHENCMPKSSQKYPVVLEKTFILLFVLFLATAAILDIRPDPNFTVLRHWSQFMLHVKFENCRSSRFIVEDV